MNKIISIEGNIGSGKSTLIKKLQEFIKEKSLVFLEEPVDEWMEIKDDNGVHILSKFYENQDKYSFPFQMMAYISRLNKLKNALTANKIILTERSLSTDKYVFAQMLYDTKKIDTYEYQIYNKWFEHFQNFLKTYRFVYLKTNFEVCAKRVKKRQRSGETEISEEYLKQNNEYHDRWLLNHNNVLLLDGNQDNEKVPNLLDKYCKQIIDSVQDEF